MDSRKESKNKLIILDVSDSNLFLKDINNCKEKKDIEDLLTLFKTYQYTDKVEIIADRGNYGSLLNYYANGLLTKEELIESIQR